MAKSAWMLMHIRDFAASALAPATTHRLWLDVAPRADGGQWQLPLIAVCGAHAGPTATVFGAVHGDEHEGTEVTHWLAQQLQPQDMHGTVLMVPVCNVPAYGACTRNSPIDGLNLARVFPGKPDGSISEQIAFWLTETCIRGSSMLIDVHSAGINYNLPTLVGHTHSSAPHHVAGQAAARAFAQHNDIDVVWAHPAPVPPGRSLSAADALGVPSIYTEAEGGGRVSARVRASFCTGVCNVLAHLGILRGEQNQDQRPIRSEPVMQLIGDGNLDRQISAPCAGHFVPARKLLDRVSAGDVLGRIVDLTGTNVAEVTAPGDGILITLRAMQRVHAGDGIGHLTQVRAM